MARISKKCKMFESKKYWEELDITTYQFFKVMIGDFGRELVIPRKFHVKIRENLSENSTLVGPSGQVWSVKLVKIAEETFFQSGWEKFVQDHCLKISDFLVFKYNGNSSFNVTIFDKSGCEREGSYFLKKHGSCSDDRCALEDTTMNVPIEIRDRNSPHSCKAKEPLSKGREGGSTKSSDIKHKSPIKTASNNSGNAYLPDASKVPVESIDAHYPQREVPIEIIEVDSPQRSTVKQPFRKGREDCRTETADKKLERPLQTVNRNSQNGNLPDVAEELDLSKDHESWKNSLFDGEYCLPKKNTRKKTFDPAYQASGSGCHKSKSSEESRLDSQKSASFKSRKRMRYSYVPYI